MTLAERLATDLKNAMLARNSLATDTLRLVKSELQNSSIAAGHDLSDEEIIQIIRKEVKKRKEAALSFKNAGSDDRANQEQEEALLLEKYLPAQADPVVVEAFIQNILTTNQNKGEVIRTTLAHFAGTTDGKVVSEIVNRLS